MIGQRDAVIILTKAFKVEISRDTNVADGMMLLRVNELVNVSVFRPSAIFYPECFRFEELYFEWSLLLESDVVLLL